MSRAKDIRESIKRIAGAKGMPLFAAEVTAVDGKTCTVKHGTLELSDVRLVSVANKSTNHIVVTPATGSVVLVADLSGGDMRDLAVIQYGEIEKITINGGDLGGLIKIDDLTAKLNSLADTVNSLVQTFNSHTHQVSTTGSAAAQTGMAVAVTSPAQEADKFKKDDYENPLIKH